MRSRWGLGLWMTVEMLMQLAKVQEMQWVSLCVSGQWLASKSYFGVGMRCTDVWVGMNVGTGEGAAV